jgi:3-methyladenine DNA glycosylase AlkD
MIEEIIVEITSHLKKNSPRLTEEQLSGIYRIINSNNPNSVAYGNKHSDIEKFIREVQNKFELKYKDGLEIFEILIKSNVHDEKIAGILLLNRFKKDFNVETLSLIRKLIPNYYDTWAITDTTMIRVLGPFLAKKGNEALAEKVITSWSKSEHLWLRRASMVILLKIIMVKKDFDADYVFALVEKMRNYPEDYIHKGIGWLLKTCSKYKPNVIYEYLMNNKKKLSRLILRYASKKLPIEMRKQVLNKQNYDLVVGSSP